MGPSPTAHALAGANPRRFLAAESVDVVQLPAMEGPQSVLAYLQHAAAGQGPLLVWVTGQLMVPSRRGGGLHLALRESTPATVRYTGLPWAWLTRTLSAHAGPALLMVDAEADAGVWPHAAEAVRDGRVFEGVPVFGVITEAGAEPAKEAGPYTRAFLDCLRAGDPTAGPVLDVRAVHQKALAEGEFEGRMLAVQYGLPGPVLANHGEGGPPRVPAAEAGGASVPARPAGPARVPAEQGVPGPEAVPSSRDGILAEILAAAHAGRHNEAAAMAAAWEQHSLRRSGPDSPEAGLWTEVRADLARLAGDHARAAELWMAAVRGRLARGGARESETLAALKRAHYCWQHSGPRAVPLAPSLLALWEQVPGAEGAAADIRARLRECQDAPPTTAR
ncbi:hypothetical protein ACFP1Z_22225 [Streptomyces gamaensis]|uniref:Uncharacterized protein n=1 Tax=Streptomyces gamaensis TaxID=1763542 RepID=A0ABW0Z4Z1_9ACTN